jgi:spermidine synthase
MLVLGLGLGYYAYRIGRKKEVTQITIVEKSEEVIRLFEDSILPQFEKEIQAKIHIQAEDAHAFMRNVKDGEYDGVFADLWKGAVDGHAWYEELHAYEKEMKHTRFDYWIERYIHDEMQ